MIRPRMARPVKLLLVSTALLALATTVAACGSFGTESVKVQKSQGALFQGAVLFNERCSGCHTLSYAATHGSASNVRTSQYNNGPNFDQRCERPVTRVLYAIANGGFSGAIMPQNIVVGQQAIQVAKFVSTYSGRKAPKVPGVVPCLQEPVGTVPALAGTTGVSGTTGTTGAAIAQARKVSGKQKQTSGKVRPSKRKGGRGGKPASTGKGQGTGSQ
jgi:mono/diheme cytochrome c family protein